MTTLITEPEVLEMANKAFDESSFTDAEVIRFAKLVAEAEREACAKVCAQVKGEMYSVNGCIAAIRARGGEAT